MRPQDLSPKVDQNWSWPEKTWFRERLNTLRAREQEAHRKPTAPPKNPAAVKAKPDSDQGNDKA